MRGFELWIPPVANAFDDGLPVYEVIGHDAQFVQFPLRAGRSVTCFSGAMAYMSETVKMEVKLAGIMNTLGRLAGGGSIFQVTYTNESDTKEGYIAMTPDYPGIIVPIDMKVHGEIVALRDSYLCSTIPQYEEETQVGADLFKPEGILGFCCAGFDFIVQTIKEGEWAFLMAMGTVITKNLEPGESILVDSDSLLCFEKSVSIDVTRVGGICSMLCAGEGLFHTRLEGPGKIWMQSMSIDKLRKLFLPPPSDNKSSENSGESDAGGIGDVIGDIAGAFDS